MHIKQGHTYMTCLVSRKPGWQHERCRGRQSAPLDVQNGCFGSQFLTAVPRQRGTSDDAHVAAADAAAESALT